MDTALTMLLRANLFHAAHAAIPDWSTFLWHRDRDGNIQAHKPWSSQALAIDVFGTIKQSPERDLILDRLAIELDLPPGGPWKVELEWTDWANSLRERKRTQVDAAAFGSRAAILFECKFTEPGGGCSQVAPHSGMRQCTSDYRLQQNPLNGRTARCALSGKGIRYWEHVPRVLGYAADVDHVPCPFVGEQFQWMRNLVLADAVAESGGFASAVVVAFAGRRGLPMSEKVSSREWAAFSARCGAGGSRLHALSYDDILAGILRVSTDTVWCELRAWVNSKIHAAP